MYIKHADARGYGKYWLLCQIVGLPSINIQSVIRVPANEWWRGMEEDGAAKLSVLTRREEDRASHFSKRPSNFHHSSL